MTTYTPTYTGADELWTVPTNVYTITVDAKGAGGGGSTTAGGSNPAGAAGGRAQCTLTVTPGETLRLQVGQAGGTGVSARYGGGGASGSVSTGSGGGATAVYRGTATQANALAIGPGGGGAGANATGGTGGGTTGTAGAVVGGAGAAGGGTPSAGGAAGTGLTANGVAGTALTGGTGGTAASFGGGGGGGGYYGGGGGGSGNAIGAAHGGGGGGSALTTGTGTSTTVGGGSATVVNGVLTLTYTVNTAPTAPVVTAPNGGEVITASTTTITWTGSTDADADAITYDLDYSTNNGGAWTSITTGVSATSYVWTVSGVASSTACLVRVRATDVHANASAYDQSNAVFTISHNVAPTAPSALNPSGSTTIDRTVTQRFSWTFNDPDAGDTQSKFDLQYRIGVGSWTTVTTTTTNAFNDFAPSTFSAASYEWQVRTYDALGVVSPWSSSAFFTAASPPATPTITSPTNGSTQGSQSGVVAWSAPAQDSYQVRKVADLAGAADTSTIYYDTSEVVSTTARNAALTFPTNSRTEHLQVRVKVATLWSTWADVRVVVSYTPPAVPTLVATVDNANARTTVAFTDPTPTGSQPTVSSHDVYRRIGSSGSGTRLAAAVGGTAWIDYTPGSLTAYQYQLIANGSNGTSTPSAWTA